MRPEADLGAASIPENFLSGSGEMAERIRQFDWSSTSLGPVEGWSPALRTMLNVLLANRFPHVLWWGPDYIQFYNDPYRPIPGTKHPVRALGRPARECWAEVWHVIGPLIDSPYYGGPATWDEDIFLELDRHGFVEETHFTIAYSPVPDEAAPSGIGGVLATVHEITEKVVGERRVRILRDLGATGPETRTAEEACAAAAETLARYPKDIPFALVYLLDSAKNRVRLEGAAGVPGGGLAAPPVIERVDGPSDDRVWPLAEVLGTESMVMLKDLSRRIPGMVPPGPWSDPPRQAVVVPIRSNIPHQLAGFLVLGVSSRLELDDSYLGFFELIAGQIAAAVGNARAYEEERRRAAALAELDRAKTAFFSNVSHEFRTPLTLMLGPVEELLGKSYTDLSPSTKGQLEIIHRNSLRLLRLVNTLLDFSRIEAGRIEASYQPTDLAAVTAELASSFRSACERAGLRLIVACPPLPEPAYVDRDMWEKIVLNLLSNAFKFTLDGQIEVALEARDATVQLTVRDSGVGIPVEELPHMFERFHRVKDSRGRTHEGTGIGLALVQELARLHGGTVGVESVLGEGTAFTVTIPRGREHLDPRHLGKVSASASSVTASSAFVEEALRWLPGTDGAGQPGDATPAALAATAGGEPRRTSEKGRIVWADDNADMRGYVTRLLSEQFEVEAVDDGEAALISARERHPDLVLSDVMMPRLDGFGLLRELRADPHTAEIPVILLSARAGEASRIEGVRAGADDYLIKPFSARELVARVETHVKMSRLRREAARALRESETRLASQKEALELAVGGASLDAVLRVIARAAQEQVGHEARASIFTVDPDGVHLRFGASGMPETYTAAVDGFVIGPDSPSCGKAAYTGRPVIDRDVETEPLWVPYLGLARNHDFRACFSFPILSYGGRVLGTLAVYHRTPCDPDLQTVGMISLLAQTSAVIIEWYKEAEERKRATEALSRRTAQFETLLGKAPLGVYLVDDGCRIREVNPTALPLFGDIPDLIGRDFDEVMHLLWPREYADEIVRLFRHTLETGEPYATGERIEERLDRGVKEYYEWQINRIPLPDGRYGVVCYFRDIAAQVFAREAVEESQARLRQSAKMEAIGRLAGGIAHDFNNQLHVILGFTDIVTRDPGLSARGRRDLAQVQSVAQRMAGLTRQLLAYSRRQVLMPATVNLNDAVRDSHAMLHQLIGSEIEMVAHLAPESIWIRVDPSQFLQVLMNLALNARDSMVGGGALLLETSIIESTRHPMPAGIDATSGRYACLQVTDSGAGIAEAHLPHLFEPFFTTKDVGKGTGLGLATVQGIVMQSDGYVWAENVEGGGARFTVLLPLKPPPEPPAGSPS